MQSSRVYAIKAMQSDGSAILKIGVSTDVARRMKGLQGGYPFALTLIKDWEGGWRTEQDLHRRFAEYRINGEWYRLCDETSAMVDQLIRDGVKNLDTFQYREDPNRRYSADVAPLLADDYAEPSPLPYSSRDLAEINRSITHLFERIAVIERRLMAREP